MAGMPWRRVLPAAWLGWLLCTALAATPAPFAVLARADAGRVVARVLAAEAYLSLALGVVLLLIERAASRAEASSRFSTGMVLALGTLFCTIVGYFAVQPLLAAARMGQGVLGFGQLHTASLVFFAIKVVLVAALAWRGSR
jgi:hypothetical protein